MKRQTHSTASGGTLKSRAHARSLLGNTFSEEERACSGGKEGGVGVGILLWEERAQNAVPVVSQRIRRQGSG
jgi:hypothetical protein